MTRHAGIANQLSRKGVTRAGMPRASEAGGTWIRTHELAASLPRTPFRLPGSERTVESREDIFDHRVAACCGARRQGLTDADDGMVSRRGVEVELAGRSGPFMDADDCGRPYERDWADNGGLGDHGGLVHEGHEPRHPGD